MPKTMTPLQLDPEADALLTRLAESGQYGDRREIVRIALEMLDGRQEQARWEAFKLERDIARSLKQAAEGKCEDAEVFFERMMRSLDAKMAPDAAE